MERERNIHVTLLKLISASFIVFIHVRFPGDFGQILDCVARFSVPLFFIISGYYAYHIEVKQIKRRLKKICILAVLSNGLYLLWNCYLKWDIYHESLKECITSFLNTKTISIFLFTGQNPFSDHLWYLSAMILIYIVLLIVTKFWERGSEVCYTPFYIIAVCAFMFQIAFGLKAESVNLEISYLMYRYFLFFGFPFFYFGIFMHEYGERIANRYRLKYGFAIVILITGIVLSLLQWFKIGKVEVPLGMLLVVAVMAVFAFIKPQPRFSRKRLFIGMEIVSTVVYIIHPLIRNIIITYKDSFDLLNQIWINSYLYPLFVLGISIVIGVVVAVAIITFRWCVNLKSMHS